MECAALPDTAAASHLVAGTTAAMAARFASAAEAAVQYNNYTFERSALLRGVAADVDAVHFFKARPYCSDTKNVVLAAVPKTWFSFYTRGFYCLLVVALLLLSHSPSAADPILTYNTPGEPKGPFIPAGFAEREWHTREPLQTYDEQQQQQQQQHKQQQQQQQQQQQDGWAFGRWLVEAFRGTLMGLGCSTAAFACAAAALNATCAALLLCSAWRRPLKATEADSLSERCSSSSSNSVVLPVEMGRLWRLRVAARALGRTLASCCFQRSSSNGSSTAVHQQKLREKRWLPWLISDAPAAETAAATTVAADTAAADTAAPAAAAVGTAETFTVGGIWDFEAECSDISDKVEPTAAGAVAAAETLEEQQQAWLDAPQDVSFWCLPDSAKATAANAVEATEAEALECLLQSYSHRPPLLQWVVYFIVAFLWTIQVYALAAIHGPLLGASGTLSGRSSSSSATASAHALLLLTELLLGVCLLGCLLSESAYIVGKKKQKPKSRRAHVFVLLLCCCFGAGFYCFYATHSSAASAAAAVQAAATPFAAADTQPETDSNRFSYSMQQQQPLQAAAAAKDPLATASGEPPRDAFSPMETGASSFLLLADSSSQYQLQQQQQAWTSRHPIRNLPRSSFVQLGPSLPYPVTNLSSSSSSNNNSSSNSSSSSSSSDSSSNSLQAFHAIEVEWDGEGPTPPRRLSASPWVSAAAARYLAAAEAADDFGEGATDDGSSSTKWWAWTVSVMGQVAAWLGRTWGALHLRASGAFGALPICCLLLPLVLLRVAAAAITLDLVRNEDALAQKRDSAQKNSLQWLVSSMCLSSAHVLPLFLWVHLARAEGWSRWIPVRGIDPLMLLHGAASVALYVHLRKGCFRVGRKSLLKSISFVHNTFDLVKP